MQSDKKLITSNTFRFSFSPFLLYLLLFTNKQNLNWAKFNFELRKSIVMSLQIKLSGLK